MKTTDLKKGTLWDNYMICFALALRVKRESLVALLIDLIKQRCKHNSHGQIYTQEEQKNIGENGVFKRKQRCVEGQKQACVQTHGL